MTGYYDNDYELVNPQINKNAANLSSIQTRTFGKMAVAMIISAVVALFMAMKGIQFGLAFALIGLLAVVVLNMWLGAKSQLRNHPHAISCSVLKACIPALFSVEPYRHIHQGRRSSRSL